jgi:hypothetical protein
MVAQYIEGCMNDFEAGISTKVETENHIHRLIIHLIKLDRKNRSEVKNFINWMGKEKIDAVIPFFAIQEGRDGKQPHWTNSKRLFNADELLSEFKKVTPP